MNQDAGKWFEDDSFWKRMFPFMFPEANFTVAAENVAKIAALTGRSSGNVLDLGCGPGRYAIPFAKAGFIVTGVDRTRFLLDKARDLAAGAHVEWLQQDMLEFVRPNVFDLALNVFTSFGYFDDASDNRRVLENVYDSLKPGAIFVFDHIGKELLAARYQPTRSESLPDGTVLIHRTTVIDDWSRIDSEWILLEESRSSKFRVRHWLYSGREIHDLLASVGFVDVSLRGSFEGTPYGPEAQRLIAIARKPLA